MLREFSAPIPGPKQYDWAAVPAPQDCGEALGDPTALCGRIVYEGSYHRQDLSGAMETCLLRETLCRKLCQAVNKPSSSGSGPRQAQRSWSLFWTTLWQSP